MIKPIKENILKVYGREPKTLDELAQCVIKVIESQENSGYRNPEFRNHKVLGFSWDIRRSETVSNSHSAPEGYPQNFNRDESLPTSYPGWVGRVWIRYHDYPDSFSSSGVFKKTLTHTGTGSSGAYDGIFTPIAHARYIRYGLTNPKDCYPEVYCYSWDYRFYDLDWPEIAKDHTQRKIIHYLGGPKSVDRHSFSWIDPETKHRDDAFMLEVETWKAIKKKIA